jgi:hypothetical protein
MLRCDHPSWISNSATYYHLLISSSARASRSFLPSPAPRLLPLLPPLALLALLLMPLSASATRLLLDDKPPGKHPGMEIASGSDRLLLLLLWLCALLPALRERLSDLMLLPMPDSVLARPLLKDLLRRLLVLVLVLLLGLGRGVGSPLLLLALLRVRPWPNITGTETASPAAPCC